MAENAQGFALDWDTEIDTDGQEYLVLEEGDYNFDVISFERKQFPGSAKIPPCKKAEITLRIASPEGTTTCKVDLILYSTMMWKIAEFFRAIGQKQRGQAFAPNWSTVVGSSGRAHFKPRTYEDKSGKNRKVNDVESFYDYDPAQATPPAVEGPVVTAPAWGGGKF